MAKRNVIRDVQNFKFPIFVSDIRNIHEHGCFENETENENVRKARDFSH